MFKFLSKIIKNKKESQENTQSNNEIDLNYPEDLLVEKSSNFTVRKLLGIFLTVFLTVGSLLGYSKFFKQNDTNNFTQTHTAFITEYITKQYTIYREDNTDLQALREERNSYLEKMTIVTYNEVLTQQVISARVYDIAIQDIQKQENNKYSAHIRFYIQFLHQEDTHAETTNNKVMEVNLPYQETSEKVFYAITPSTIIFDQDILPPDNSIKDKIKQDIADQYKLEGDTLSTQEESNLREQFITFFDAYSDSTIRAQALIAPDIVLPIYYHGRFDTKRMLFEAKKTKEEVTVIVTIDYVAKNELFLYPKVFKITLKDKTIIRFEEL